jgi:cell division protein FtsL
MNGNDRDNSAEGETVPDQPPVSPEAESGDFRVNFFTPEDNEDAAHTLSEDDYRVDLSEDEDTEEEVSGPEDVSNEIPEPEVVLAEPPEKNVPAAGVRVVKVPSRRMRATTARARSQTSQSPPVSKQREQRRSYVPKKKSSPLGPWLVVLLIAVIVLSVIAIAEKVMISRLTAEKDRLNRKMNSYEVESQELQQELETAYGLVRRYRDRTPPHLRRQIEPKTKRE